MMHFTNAAVAGSLLLAIQSAPTIALDYSSSYNDSSAAQVLRQNEGLYQEGHTSDDRGCAAEIRGGTLFVNFRFASLDYMDYPVAVPTSAAELVEVGKSSRMQWAFDGAKVGKSRFELAFEMGYHNKMQMHQITLTQYLPGSDQVAKETICVFEALN